MTKLKKIKQFWNGAGDGDRTHGPNLGKIITLFINNCISLFCLAVDSKTIPIVFRESRRKRLSCVHAYTRSKTYAVLLILISFLPAVLMLVPKASYASGINRHTIEDTFIAVASELRPSVAVPLPRVVSNTKLIEAASRAPVNPFGGQGDAEAFYLGNTIFLKDDWDEDWPHDRGLLAHEMCHHVLTRMRVTEQEARCVQVQRTYEAKE